MCFFHAKKIDCVNMHILKRKKKNKTKQNVILTRCNVEGQFDKKDNSPFFLLIFAVNVYSCYFFAALDVYAHAIRIRI